MSAAAELTGAHMKYLAVIYEVSCAGNTVSCAEVARRLGVTRPSVSRMLDVLNEKGMTTKERYGKIALTEEGQRGRPDAARPDSVGVTKTPPAFDDGGVLIYNRWKIGAMSPKHKEMGNHEDRIAGIAGHPARAAGRLCRQAGRRGA